MGFSRGLRGLQCVNTGGREEEFSRRVTDTMPEWWGSWVKDMGKQSWVSATPNYNPGEQ